MFLLKIDTISIEMKEKRIEIKHENEKWKEKYANIRICLYKEDVIEWIFFWLNMKSIYSWVLLVEHVRINPIQSTVAISPNFYFFSLSLCCLAVIKKK